MRRRTCLQYRVQYPHPWNLSGFGEVGRPAEGGERGEQNVLRSFGLVRFERSDGVVEELGESRVSGAVLHAPEFTVSCSQGDEDLLRASPVDGAEAIDDDPAVVVKVGQGHDRSEFHARAGSGDHNTNFPYGVATGLC